MKPRLVLTGNSHSLYAHWAWESYWDKTLCYQNGDQFSLKIGKRIYEYRVQYQTLEHK